VAREVVDEATATLVPRNLAISYDVPEHNVTVSSRQATVLALLINELVANAIGHGMTGRRKGHLSVIAEQSDPARIMLRVEDDGQGPPDGFDLEAQAGLGLTIARTLIRADLHGTIAVARNEAGGTTVTLAFPPEMG
jgi:two-component sensor histidine kinase